MLKNYFVTAIRHLRRSAQTSLLNIVGLSIGMACCLLILLYVLHETSYDKHHHNSKRTFRVLTIDEALGVSSNLVGITLPALAPTMQDELPEVEKTVRINSNGRTMLQHKDKKFFAENLLYVEDGFFDVFNYQLIEGDENTAFEKPYTAVMTEAMAKKTFGDIATAMGKSFRMNDDNDYEIVGIMADSDLPTHLTMDVMVAMVAAESDTSLMQYLNSWNNISMSSYAVLNDASSEEAVEAKMEEIIRAHEVGSNFKVTLQPLADTHLKSEGVLFDGMNNNKGSLDYVFSLGAVAIFVIIIAAFNFMNLTTARSAKRAREVGIRKVLGSRRGELIFQHLSEAILMCLFSMIIALLTVGIVDSFVELPINGTALNFIFSSPLIVGGIIIFVLLLGILAGIYPAFMLTAFQPTQVLKGKFATSRKGAALRRILVVSQFAVSIVMIIGALTVYNQLDYIKSKNKGFDEEQVLQFRFNNREMSEKGEEFLTALKAYPEISDIGRASSLPGQGFGRTRVIPEGYTSDDDPWIYSIMSCDEQFIPTMKMEILEGRNFSKDFQTDEDAAMILNQAAASSFDWENPVGKKVNIGQTEYTVVGLVQDFHFASMRHKIEPLVIVNNPSPNRVVAKVATNGMENTLAKIEETWKEVYPTDPFEYTFFDEEFAQLYENEVHFSKLITGFAWLAVFIACLGLFGLAAFIAEQRTREIGIRKVLGSSIPRIILMLSTEFMKLVLIANLLAWPLAYWLTSNWLENFEYRTILTPTVFVVAAVLAAAIALFTISFHSIRAALLNPVDCLRDE
ncbi:ABC transporter permease [Flammeovirgaceae bacterium SG7u.111]|nr:ABC transporter permease [Flammeovirgaceae bacterium SG7u.132]WPO36247.1 ABC transporter permease [Flammeovirgaceae bacterium SG7u.111]